MRQRVQISPRIGLPIGLVIALFLALPAETAAKTPGNLEGCFYLAEQGDSCEVCDSIRFKKGNKIEMALGCDTLGSGKYSKKGNIIHARLKFQTFCSHYVDGANLSEKEFEKQCQAFEQKNSHTRWFQFKFNANQWFIKPAGKSWRRLGRFFQWR